MCGIAESMICGSVALKKKNQNDMELQRREDEVCVAILDRELGRGRSKEGAGCQSRVQGTPMHIPDIALGHRQISKSYL
jgi:hypothetical protein